MSPRAACRLETLGFQHVYDYVAGKMDWFAAGLPREGAEAGTDRVGDHARSDVPTAAPDEDAGGLEARLGDRDVCVVVNDDRIVLGLATAEALAAAAGRPVATVMSEGPTTYRPHTVTKEVVTWMRKHDKRHVLFTDPDGNLLGIATRRELESASSRAGSG
jgi:catechol 2,3-dioxygenase-like lactoylglutathione lyase family enzyme